MGGQTPRGYKYMQAEILKAQKEAQAEADRARKDDRTSSEEFIDGEFEVVEEMAKIGREVKQ